jgi:hypothetical protein
MSDLIQLLTGKLTGTPKHFSTQPRTSVNKTPLYRPLGGRPRTAMDSRCRIPPSAVRVFASNPTRTQVRLQAARGFFVFTSIQQRLQQHRNPIISGARNSNIIICAMSYFRQDPIPTSDCSNTLFLRRLVNQSSVHRYRKISRASQSAPAR